MARADVSAQHERRRSVRPAFEDVWTTGFLTDGVQVQALNQFQNIVLIGGIAQPDFQPFGLGLSRFGRIADDV
jgi:hypothetical protein